MTELSVSLLYIVDVYRALPCGTVDARNIFQFQIILLIHANVSF